jgi:hypothetical protein
MTSLSPGAALDPEASGAGDAGEQIAHFSSGGQVDHGLTQTKQGRAVLSARWWTVNNGIFRSLRPPLENDA